MTSGAGIRGRRSQRPDRADVSVPARPTASRAGHGASRKRSAQAQRARYGSAVETRVLVLNLPHGTFLARCPAHAHVSVDGRPVPDSGYRLDRLFNSGVGAATCLARGRKPPQQRLGADLAPGARPPARLDHFLHPHVASANHRSVGSTSDGRTSRYERGCRRRHGRWRRPRKDTPRSIGRHAVQGGARIARRALACVPGRTQCVSA